MSKVLDSILSQYEKNTQEKSSKRMSSQERLKKYFTEKLQKGVKSQTKRFRLLPTKDGSSPFQEVHYHEKNVNGRWEKIYCNHLNDGEHCPLCEAKNALYEEGSEKARKLASEFIPRKFYVVKGIDRENEEDGVKFWRFKHKKTGDGVMDKLIPVFQQKGDITDAREGRDIIITTGRNKEKANEWYNNEETHRDVYSKKSEEYLNIVATNKTPVWDSEQSKYVAEEDREEKETASLEEEINLMSNGSEHIFGSDTSNNDDVDNGDDSDDELPF
jgi:hypothetical protein